MLAAEYEQTTLAARLSGTPQNDEPFIAAEDLRSVRALIVSQAARGEAELERPEGGWGVTGLRAAKELKELDKAVGTLRKTGENATVGRAFRARQQEHARKKRYPNKKKPKLSKPELKDRFTALKGRLTKLRGRVVADSEVAKLLEPDYGLSASTILRHLEKKK